MTNDSALCLRNLSKRIKVSTIFRGDFLNIQTLNIHLFGQAFQSRMKRSCIWWVMVATFNKDNVLVGEILLIPSAAEHYFRVFSCPAATPPCKSDVNLVFCTWPSGPAWPRSAAQSILALHEEMCCNVVNSWKRVWSCDRIRNSRTATAAALHGHLALCSSFHSIRT